VVIVHISMWVAVNLTIGLGTRLAAKPCHVFNSDMRLLVERSGLYTYPDVMVVCGKIRLVERRNDTLTNPILIVEVLSESTRDYDRGAKFNFYKQIPTLQEYVLVESEHAHVEVYRRAGDPSVDSGQAPWVIEMSEGLDATVRLISVEGEIPLAQVYSKVSWLD